MYCLLVEEVGSCTDNKNEKRFKKEYAKKYALSFTPGNLDTFMEKEKIDSKLWPDSKQIENRRAGSKPQLNRYSISCLGELQKFIDKAPEDVVICVNHVILREDKCRILFTGFLVD